MARSSSGTARSPRRHFGTVRQRSSGRWQALYRVEGRTHSAGVYRTKADAQARLSMIEADLHRGEWIDSRAASITLALYATQWLALRSDLAQRTRELYEYLLEHHIVPALGSITLVGLAPSKIRAWHASLATDHPSTAAKAYRLLSTILRTAVSDGLILTSPCRVSGAGVERAAPRPVATVREIADLERAMPEHLRLIVSLATWCQLRRAELLGLRRRDIDLEHGIVHVEQSRTYTMRGKSLVKEPKTSASRRTIAIPGFLTSAIRDHLERFTGSEPDSFVFTGKTGIPLGVNVLQVTWQRARARVGRTDLRLHDLRHTGLTLAAATGATTVELMHRAGHSSAVAAMRYQHATKDRDRLIAEALDHLVVSSAETTS